MGNYRKFKVSEAEPPTDVKEAFERYSDDGIHMTADQLRRFLEESQCNTDTSVSEAKRIVKQIQRKRHHLGKFINRKALSLEDFHHFLFSTDLNPPINSQVHHDMNAPLSHYFIYTGHNSYFTGNLSSSKCSETPIIKALKRGVRVIELDLWPNSSKNNVHVHHGRNWTSHLELMRCLKVIKEYAFMASPYPVIIILEDHLTPDLQTKVAQMVIETFGDMLFVPESEKSIVLPSPESLKFRILISTKSKKEYLGVEDDNGWDEEPSRDGPYEDKYCKSGRDKSDHDVDSKDCRQEKKSPSSPAYKRLIAFNVGEDKGGLKNALEVEKDNVRPLSLAVEDFEKVVGNHGRDVVRYSWKSIIRIYLRRTRNSSSNYNPIIWWLHGAQMVAFNMQGYGRSLWLMHGMFRANGGCGYVKKQDFLTLPGPRGELFDPQALLPTKWFLKVTLYMGDGWHLDFKETYVDVKSKPHFYTLVGIAGSPSDSIMKQTRIKEDTWAPVWNEELSFPLTIPEFALLRIEVHDDILDDDDDAGQICLLVSDLRPGIRAIPLCDRKGDQYASARLLMRFELE